MYCALTWVEAEVNIIVNHAHLHACVLWVDYWWKSVVPQSKSSVLALFDYLIFQTRLENGRAHNQWLDRYLEVKEGFDGWVVFIALNDNDSVDPNIFYICCEYIEGLARCVNSDPASEWSQSSEIYRNGG